MLEVLPRCLQLRTPYNTGKNIEQWEQRANLGTEKIEEARLNMEIDSDLLHGFLGVFARVLSLIS